MNGHGDGSVCLTSVSVGGLVEHEHGIVDLGGRQTTKFFWRRSLSCHEAYCLTSALLKFCREAQQQMDRKEGEGGREGGRAGGRERTGDERQVTEGRQWGDGREI